MKALIVDDDPVTQKMLGKILEGRGHNVSVCSNAMDAFDLYCKESFPLVLLDWILPGENGLELCRKMRALPNGDRSVILMITSCDKPEDLQSVLDAGADDYLAKPVTIGSLKVRLAIAERQVKSIKERKRLEKEVINISAGEQERIGQDLHDTLGQYLTGVAFMSRALERKLSARNLDEAKDAAKIETLVNNALGTTQKLAQGLYPVELVADGLQAALQNLAKTNESLFGIPCRFSTNEEGVEINEHDVAIQIYRIAQEAINNAVKHSGASFIEIELRKAENRIVLTVQDNGKGISRFGARKKGMGLNIMNYRTRIIGAALDIRQHMKGGTVVECTISGLH